MTAAYLLDTTVLLHFTRGSKQAAILDQQLQLSSAAFRPLICEVSLGEMRAFARNQRWEAARLERLAAVEQQVVTIDISDDRVMDAYADLSTLAKTSGWALFHGKNDLWIGAATRATNSHLLTMDTDFLPLRGRVDMIRFGGRVTYVDLVSSSFVEESLQALGGIRISIRRSLVAAGERPVVV